MKHTKVFHHKDLVLHNVQDREAYVVQNFTSSYDNLVNYRNGYFVI